MVDISIFYNSAISILQRFLNWSFVIWGVTVHVYSIVIFTFLVILLVKFIGVLRGV